MENNTLLEELKSRLKIILANSYKDIKPELEEDLNAFLETSGKKLERWILLFSTSAITEEELEWLLKSQIDLVPLQALQSTGISKIRLNTLKNNILKTIFKVIIELVIPVI